MKDIQARLLKFAESKCLPYLLERPEFNDYLEKLSFVLVGSVPTGFCNENSDIDIAIVCNEETYKSISSNTAWDKGKPSEVYLDNIQLHYYAITFNRIEDRLKELDDIYLYVYGNCIILKEPNNQYTERFKGLFPYISEVRKQRLEGKLDMLLRRYRGFKSAFNEIDILMIARICLELITLCLKTIALLDNVPFDPRKRLFNMALSGNLGCQLDSKMRQLFCELGNLGQLINDLDFTNFSFCKKIDEVIQIISNEAISQGFRIGLEKPDIRHLE